MIDASDIELLKAWEDGDRDAGVELVERHYALVYRFLANKVGGRSELEDLVQQTFLGCVEARARCTQRCSFKAFVLAVARERLYRHLRTQHRRGEPDFAITSIRDVGTSPSGFVARRNDPRQGTHAAAELSSRPVTYPAVELSSRPVGEALQRLPLEAQLTLELAFWERMTDRELALIFDVPLEAASSQLKRSQELMREQLVRLREPGPEERERLELEAWLGGLHCERQEAPREV